MYINPLLVNYRLLTLIGFIGLLFPRLVLAINFSGPTPYRGLVFSAIAFGIIIISTFFVFYPLLRKDFSKDKEKLMRKIAYFLIPGLLLTFGFIFLERYSYLNIISQFAFLIYVSVGMLVATLLTSLNLIFIYASLAMISIMPVVIKYLFSISFKKAFVIYIINSLVCYLLIYAFFYLFSPLIYDLIDLIKPELFKLLK